jgi:hypothetical protein
MVIDIIQNRPVRQENKFYFSFVGLLGAFDRASATAAPSAESDSPEPPLEARAFVACGHENNATLRAATDFLCEQVKSPGRPPAVRLREVGITKHYRMTV